MKPFCGSGIESGKQCNHSPVVPVSNFLEAHRKLFEYLQIQYYLPCQQVVVHVLSKGCNQLDAD